MWLQEADAKRGQEHARRVVQYLSEARIGLASMLRCRMIPFGDSDALARACPKGLATLSSGVDGWYSLSLFPQLAERAARTIKSSAR